MRQSRTVSIFWLLVLTVPVQAGDRVGADATVEDEIRKGAMALLDRIAIRSTVHYRQLLNDDAAWLIKSMRPGGWYTYDRKSEHADNSVTQFANLGLWAAADALAEVPASYWATVEKHWLTGQRPDGGWAYSDGD